MVVVVGTLLQAGSQGRVALRDDVRMCTRLARCRELSSKCRIQDIVLEGAESAVSA